MQGEGMGPAPVALRCRHVCAAPSCRGGGDGGGWGAFGLFLSSPSLSRGGNCCPQLWWNGCWYRAAMMGSCHENLATGPCRPGREAWMQSIALQEEFVRMSCPIQTGAPRMQFHTWFLHLSGVQVQSNLTSRCLTHTRTHRHTQAHAHAAVLQSNSSSVALSSICFFLDPDAPGVGLAAVPSL